MPVGGGATPVTVLSVMRFYRLCCLTVLGDYRVLSHGTR